MTTHCLSRDSLLPGETSADAFRRLAREKPGKGRPCGYCGQDHRGPAEFWPLYELVVHNNAVAQLNRELNSEV